MKAPHPIVAVVAISCALLVGLQLSGHFGAAAIAKLIASTAFVTLAIQRRALASRYGRLILIGLVLSWGGDMFLVGRTQAFFLAGLSAFLLAHIAYSAAFIAHGVQRLAAAVAAVVVGLIAIVVWTWLEPNTPADLSLPVRAYIAVISLMVVLAFGTRGASSCPTCRWRRYDWSKRPGLPMSWDCRPITPLRSVLRSASRSHDPIEAYPQNDLPENQ